jgi:RNA polymerase sigma-70 factor, ECF subfamily
MTSNWRAAPILAASVCCTNGICPAVFRYVSGKVSSPKEAEDLTSEAFRQAWTSRRAYRARGTFRAWLFSIARRSVADHYRSHRPAAALESAVADRMQDSAPGPEHQVLREDQSRTARALLAGLSVEQREVLSLRFAAELTYAEIALVIGKREEAVKKIAQRALEAIRGRQTYSNPTDTRLEALERELGPVLRSGFDVAPRPGFATALRAELFSIATRERLPHPRLVRRQTWAAVAAALAASVVVGLAVFATRPQTVSAEEAPSQLQTEAVTSLAATPKGACPGGSGDVAFVDGGGPAQAQGPVTINGSAPASPTDLSDKLAQALGVSGDRVRQAMLETMRAEMPSDLPPDPMAIIAQQLGVSTDLVCAAFEKTPITVRVGQARTQDGPSAAVRAGATGANVKQGPPGAIGVDGNQVLDLSTATPEQLTGPARQLAVSPEKLAAAVHTAAATLAQTSPPAPPNKDGLIARFAQNLGMSPEAVTAAITQVEGPNRFYFGVQLPDVGK